MEPDVAGECPLRRQCFAKVTLSTKEQASSAIIVYTKKGCKAVQRHLAEAEVTTIGLGQVIDVCRVWPPWPPHWQVYSPDRAGVFPDKKREEVRGTLSKQRILCGSCA
jgi:hypothetical protein